MKKYVVLTGSKNNAGDFLIKYRGKQLLNALVDGVQITDIDRWRPLTHEQLDAINGSNGLILLGGPALRPEMYPGIYPLTSNLNDIAVPIVSMGIGWKSHAGQWESTKNYFFTSSTRTLLDRMAADGYMSSVRDYHSLNALLMNGYENFVMTGCPALYDLEHVGKPFVGPKRYAKIGFSLGVEFVASRKMREQMQELILKTKAHFADSEFVVAIHHAIGKHDESFRSWFDSNGIAWKDISGSHESMVDFYTGCDFHLGYRVHAHIFMSSISKPSLLVAEDGRGTALRSVLGGMIYDAYDFRNNITLIDKVVNRITRFSEPQLIMPRLFEREIISNIEYDRKNNYVFSSGVRNRINDLFPVMKKFIEQLP